MRYSLRDLLWLVAVVCAMLAGYCWQRHGSDTEIARLNHSLKVWTGGFDDLLVRYDRQSREIDGSRIAASRQQNEIIALRAAIRQLDKEQLRGLVPIDHFPSGDYAEPARQP